MENGLTSQFTARVTARPAGLRPTFRMEVKSTFIIMGVIISQIRMAIGTLIWLPLANSMPRSACTADGRSLPSSMPPTMQSATHNER